MWRLVECYCIVEFILFFSKGIQYWKSNQIRLLQEIWCEEYNDIYDVLYSIHVYYLHPIFWQLTNFKGLNETKYLPVIFRLENTYSMIFDIVIFIFLINIHYQIMTWHSIFFILTLRQGIHVSTFEQNGSGASTCWSIGRL